MRDQLDKLSLGIGQDRQTPRDREQAGYAMLLVFLMAACVAITLYIEVPRVAFEAERQRELRLVDRGNQYKRAIQVFVTETHLYPTSLDELERSNNHRYLRRRYVDPMTGKNEWRLVHISGGVLTDSITTQANSANAAAAKPVSNTPATSDFISQQAYLDTGADDTAPGGVPRALSRRSNDVQRPGAPSDPNNPGSPPPDGSQGTPANSIGAGANGLAPSVPGSPYGNNPGMPAIPGAPGQPGIPGGPANGQQQAAQTCTAYIGGCPATTSGQPSAQQPPQIASGSIPPGDAVGAPEFNTSDGAQGDAQSSAQPAAATMISNLLTTPRPGGMPSNMPAGIAGIAGVASKYEAEGIMVINQRRKINEWEFIFDPTKTAHRRIR